MTHRFFFMAGLPRTGSTVLSAILSQNPKIHSGPASPVCSVMRDLTMGFSVGSLETMAVANRPGFQAEIIGNVPHLYYKNVHKPFVIDKSRDWLFPRNLDLIRTYMAPEPKVLVLLRDREAIIDSFTKLFQKNGVPPNQAKGLVADAT
jgi:sulfotransferase